MDFSVINQIDYGGASLESNYKREDHIGTELE